MSAADELLELLEAHRERRKVAPPPEPTWTSEQEPLQWADDEGDPKETFE